MSPTLIVYNSIPAPLRLRYKNSLNKIFLAILSDHRVKAEKISFIFCDDKYLSELNAKYLKNNDLTDAISFNLGEASIVMGEIYISLERIMENARKYNVKFLHELGRVMIHGVLHLSGYEDKKPSLRKKMTFMEDYYLDKWNKINKRST